VAARLPHNEVRGFASRPHERFAFDTLDLPFGVSVRASHGL
jgi:hypothetical protein